MAEEKRREGLELLTDKGNAAAEISFRHASELYIGASKIAGLEIEESRLGQKLAAMRIELNAAAFPDRIVFKSGREIQCAVIEEDETLIRVETNQGTISVPRRTVDSLDRATEEYFRKIAALQSETEEILQEHKSIESKLEELHLTSIRTSHGDVSP